LIDEIIAIKAQESKPISNQFGADDCVLEAEGSTDKQKGKKIADEERDAILQSKCKATFTILLIHL